jgi:hypothetical protein
VLETIFIYAKDGEEKEFTEENYPWNDSTWIFVDMETRLVKEGEKPAIEDLAFESLYFDETSGTWQTGGEITDNILAEPSYTFLMIAYSLEEMSGRHLDRFREVSSYASERGYPFWLVTSSAANVVGAWEEEHQTGFHFAHADERELKTMIRSNPGLLLLKEGVVINKWDDSRVPRADGLNLPPEESDLVKMKDPKTTGAFHLLITLLLFVLPLTLLRWSERRRTGEVKDIER